MLLVGRMKASRMTRYEPRGTHGCSWVHLRSMQPPSQPWLAFFTVLLLAACSAAPQAVSSRPQDQPIYLPPTPLPLRPGSWTPTPAVPDLGPTGSSLEAEAPTSTPVCENNLRYLEDLSLPDGSLVSPGETLDKRWRVENNGTCNWDRRYRLKLIAGPSLGASEEQALYPARAGTQADLRILFTAPQEAGTYRSAWQAFSPEGQPFGDPIFIEVVVGTP